MIVDAHTHVGFDRLYQINMPSDEIIGIMDKNGIDISLVQPQVGAPDLKANHEEVYELTKKYPGRIYGMACIHPFEDEEVFWQKAEWAIKELGFKGFKIHTNGFGISPQHPDCRKIFEAGRKYGVPVMIHTGAGVPQALPSLAIPMAQEFSDVPVVLAHAGGGMYAGEAIVAAKCCENIYLETSWVYPSDILAMLKTVGADRMMFGSDITDCVASFKAIYDCIDISDSDYEKAMGGTCRDLYKLYD